jgi:hypothetical protein
MNSNCRGYSNQFDGPHDMNEMVEDRYTKNQHTIQFKGGKMAKLVGTASSRRRGVALIISISSGMKVRWWTLLGAREFDDQGFSKQVVLIKFINCRLSVSIILHPDESITTRNT